MSDSPPSEPLRQASRDEIMSALFGHLVVQNTNLALMFLGKMPNPQTGERMHDLETGRMFIDQLEMLAVKTKGNLLREEEKLLQQSLTHLRLSFVEAVEKPPEAKTETPPAPADEPKPSSNPS